MSSVLQKTMQSLEAALRYNPDSIDLKASLAEVCIRMGRFDQRTMDLCEEVLRHQIDNMLLRQAQSIGLLIEQSRAIEEGLTRDTPLPEPEAMRASIAILDEFLAQSPECIDGWIAWTRMQLLIGDFDKARAGMRRLIEMQVPQLSDLFGNSLEHVAHNPELTPAEALQVLELFRLLGSEPRALSLFEKLYDGGRGELAEPILNVYLERYSPSRPGEVPEAVRNRFFRLLLDRGDGEITGQWLRQAAANGWNVGAYTMDYARNLIANGQLREAFATLQQFPYDPEARELLNEIAARHEERDEVEDAVRVLRFLNDHALLDEGGLPQQDHADELARDTELSMAQLHLRNGRYREAVEKLVNVLCMGCMIDVELLEQIEELLEAIDRPPAEPLLRLGVFCRMQGDHPKAMAYLNQAYKAQPGHAPIADELESLYHEILATNPDLPKLRMELGRLYMSENRLDEALEQLTQAGATPHLAGEVNRLLAEVFCRKGNFQNALEKYRGAQLTEADCTGLYQLHSELIALNQPREALTALNLIARINPTWGDVQERIAVLEDQVGKLAPETVADPKMRELIGDLAIGHYQYLDRLGSGGMGVVYKVFDIRSQMTVAMKILRDSLSSSSKALDRFFREARIAATLNHRNIVKIFDYNISNMAGQSFIVMEYVDGPSVREIIDRQFQNSKPVDLAYITEILFYVIQLADALEATHKKGIIHRDIKPDNIMVNSLGEVKITDFGIVHIEEANFTPSGAMLGTPRYMAPEQVTGGKIDGRSDIYSLGILFYEALVGSPPFMSGDISYQQVHKPPIPPREVNPVIPQSINDAIMTCLAKSPDDRFPNARVIKTLLAGVLDDLGGCAKYGAQNATQVADELDPRIPGVQPLPPEVHLGLDLDLDLD